MKLIKLDIFHDKYEMSCLNISDSQIIHSSRPIFIDTLFGQWYIHTPSNQSRDTSLNPKRRIFKWH